MRGHRLDGIMTVRLAIFDLDGTLIRGNTCCELIAERIGRLDEMRKFERCVTKDEIAAARREMSRWYSPYRLDELVAPLANAIEAPGLRQGFARLRAAGVKIGIASITWSFAVEWFAQRLGVDFQLGRLLREGGTIAHVWPEDKAVWLRSLAAKEQLLIAETAAIGDSVGDVPMLLAAGRRYYVGSDTAAIPEIRHFPQGNIEDIARDILEASPP